MLLRKYNPADVTEIAQLFYDTVHNINCRDYDNAQLNVWATENVDLSAWNDSFLSHYTIVSVHENTITGFGDIYKSGYLDRLYVHKDFQHNGIATAICNALETYSKSCGISEINTYASITACPFLVKRGYAIVRENEVVRDGVMLKNYFMVKRFCD